jgi:hypothetical protein
MNNQHDPEFQSILETIRNQFDFLFQRGYQISSVIFTDAENKNWLVLLSGENCLIKIHFREQRIFLTISSVQLMNNLGMFDLHELVDLMNLEHIPLSRHQEHPLNLTGQLITTAQLLEKHMENILDLFQRIDLGIAFNKAGELLANNSPALL